MADILGAAAGYLMFVMIAGLMGCFLVEIRVLKKETVPECGRVCSLCGVFAVGEYLFMLLINTAVFGGGMSGDFVTVLQHSLFDGTRSVFASVHSFLQGCMVLMAISGLAVYFAGKENADAPSAWKGVLLFYLLPGAELCFLPVRFFFIPLVSGGILFLLRKKICIKKLMNRETAYSVLCAVFVLFRCTVLYALVMGV